MEEADIKKQYDDLLAVYSKKRSECQNIERQIPITKSQIQELKARLSEIVVGASIKSEPEVSEEQTKEKERLIKEYEELTSQLNRIQVQISQDNDPEILALKAEIKSLESANAGFVVSDNRGELQHQQQLLSTAQRNAEQKAASIRQLQEEIQNEERVSNQLRQEVQAINTQRNSSQNSGVVDDKVGQLEEELRKLEDEEKQLIESLRKEDQILEEKRTKFETQNKSQHDELTQLKWKNVELQTTLDKLEAELKYLDSQGPKKSDADELKRIEDEQRGLNKQIDSLRRELDSKKQLQAKKKQQANREKNKEKKNFKQEMIEETTAHELYSKELQREKAKLENVIKLRKSYVSQENLQILQKQYERHQKAGKPNLQAEQNKREKLTKERETIKSRISFLNESSKQMQLESETKLKELKQKGDELVKEKLENEKILGDSTYKLNEYMKQFPDHEKRKQQAKNEQKKRKHEAKEKAKLEQQRQKEIQKQRKAESKLLAEDEDKTAWQEWNNWEKAGNLPRRDQKSLFQNRQFQLIVAAIAAIALLTLSFS